MGVRTRISLWLQAMTAGAAAQLDPPVVLSAMRSFLAVVTARLGSLPAVPSPGTSLAVACIAQLADSIACHSSTCRGLAILADVRAQAQQFGALTAAAELAQVREGFHALLTGACLCWHTNLQDGLGVGKKGPSVTPGSTSGLDVL